MINGIRNLIKFLEKRPTNVTKKDPYRKEYLKAFASESQARSHYTLFANAAREEGYEQIAHFFKETSEQALRVKISNSFKKIFKIEKAAKARYLKLLENMTKDFVFKSDDENTLWLCKNCGYSHIGKKARTFQGECTCFFLVFLMGFYDLVH